MMIRLLILFIGLVSTNLRAQIINEICASNTTAYFLGEDYPDWIEIYNNAESTIDLEGWSITNDINVPQKWIFPSTLIESNAYHIMAAQEKSESATTIDFNLKKEGGFLYLINPEGDIIHSVDYPELRTDHSFGFIDGKTYFFEEPTSGNDNSLSQGFKGYAPNPTFSRISGIVPSGTNIVIRCSDEESTIYSSVHYTTQLDSCIYLNPIEINQTTNIRAIAKGDSLIDSEIVYRTFFIGISHELPVVNINADSLVLFDSSDGMYVAGDDASQDWPYYGANFWADRTVKIYYEYYNTDMLLLESLTCDLKIHGGGSRANPIKSLQLKARDSYEQKSFNRKYFEEKDVDEFKRLILRNGGNDYCNSCIKDAAFQHHLLKSELDIDLLAYRPVIVYFNGHYLGIQNMREKVDPYYFQGNYGADPEKLNLLEGNDVYTLNGESDDFFELRDYALEHDLSEEEYYDWVADQMDIPSMVDYFIVQLYTSNDDWPFNNIKIWNIPGEQKWRYVLYDLDFAFRYEENLENNQSSLSFIITNFAESNPYVAILNALLANEKFTQYFINRYEDLLNTSFKKDWITHAYRREQSKIATDMERHYETWCGPIAQWNSRFNGILGFINGRREVVEQDLSSFFDLPEPVQIVVNTYPKSAGVIELNTLKILDFPFFGYYYPTNRIRLKAVPNYGEIFSHWENTRTGERFYIAEIDIDPTYEDYFVAVFESDEDTYDLTVNPNPIQEKATAQFSLSRSQEVIILITTPSGKIIHQRNWGKLKTGHHGVTVDLTGMASGTYYVTIIANEGKETVSVVKV